MNRIVVTLDDVIDRALDPNGRLFTESVALGTKSGLVEHERRRRWIIRTLDRVLVMTIRAPRRVRVARGQEAAMCALLELSSGVIVTTGAVHPIELIGMRKLAA